MADIPNPKWYDEGTVALTQGSPVVTGTNTFWVSAGVQAGDIFLDADKKMYEITAVNDSTSLTLGENYTGATGSGKGYSIIRVFNSTMNATLANRISNLLREFEQRYDLDMQIITPKSAYDIAKDEGYTGTQSEWLETLSAYGVAVKNGYTGTAEQWLESLKAAGEWSTLNARTNILATGEIELHNSIAGFRDKGTVLTDEQKAAITNKTFDDLYIGDYWTINGHRYYIAKFHSWSGGKLMMLSNVLYNAQMNETDTNEGGYYNSWLYNTGLEQAEEILTADWGDMLMNFKEYIPDSNATGYVNFNGVRTLPYKCMIPTYRMLYGHAFSGYPQDTYCYYSDTQLPIAMFEAGRGVIHNGDDYWVQECYNSSDSFIYITTNGVITWLVLDENGAIVSNFRASLKKGIRVIFFIS